MPEFAALLLAAGGSSRLGHAKQLLTLHGQTLVKRAATLLLNITPNVLVVTGSKQREVELELEDLPLRLVENRRWLEGMGSSVAEGIGAVPVSAAGVLIMLCDQYRVQQSDLQRLVDAWQQQPRHIAVARWGKQFGSPVIFPRSMFNSLSRLSGDRGARQLLVANRTQLHFVEMPEAEFDLDDAIDLARMQRYEAQGASK
jgi:molybdenum cofactor cytidylyltransferase